VIACALIREYAVEVTRQADPRHRGRGTLLVLASRPSTGLLAAVHTCLHAERVAWMRLPRPSTS
jgi:hypothetical protein